MNDNQVEIASLAEYVKEIGIIANEYNRSNQIRISITETFYPIPLSGSYNFETDNSAQRIEKYYQKIYDHYSKDYYQIFDGRENSLFFRGQADIKYANKVCPTIYRSAETHDEKYYMNNLDVRCFSELIDKHGISKLTYLQHYGCPTRLLDITANPLVALFFACNEDYDKDGIVFVICTQEKNVVYSKSDKVLLLTKLSELSTEQQNVNGKP